MLAAIDALPLLVILPLLVAIGFVLFFVFGVLLSAITHYERPPKFAIAAIGILLCCSLSEAQTSTRSVTFAWDYNAAANATIDGFELERKDGQQGTYAKLAIVIAPTARTVVDPTASVGALQCWRLFAVKPPLRSAPSNEVCDVQLLGPINFRVQ